MATAGEATMNIKRKSREAACPLSLLRQRHRAPSPTERPVAECLEERRLLSSALLANVIADALMPAPRVHVAHAKATAPMPSATKVAPPIAPSELTAVAVSPFEVDLSWHRNSTDETGFVLERSLDPSFATINRSVTLAAGSTQFVDTTVAKTTTYYYRVYAFNAGGNSFAASASVTTPDIPPTPPAAPSGLEAWGVSNTEIDLQWTNNATNQTSLEIDRAPVGGMFSKLATVVATATTYSDYSSNDFSLKAWSYRVIAIGAAGPSTPSNVVIATTVPLNAGRIPITSPDGVFNASGFVTFNDAVYFAASDSSGNSELFRDDGSGPALAIAPAKSAPVAFNGRLYFYNIDATAGYQLWSTDGTAQGSQIVYTFGPPGGAVAPTGFAATPQYLFFIAGLSNATQIWRTDGTTDGTMPLATPTVSPIFLSPSTQPLAVGNDVYFAAGPEQVWKTDGTQAGTTMVADIPVNSGPRAFAALNGNVYFVAAQGQLWRTDGTAIGTTMLKSFNAIGSLTAVNGALYFSGSTTADGAELWTSDGTAAGTVMLKDLDAGGSNSSNGSSPMLFTAVGNEVFFIAAGGPYRSFFGLWKTDGTPQGTIRVHDFLGNFSSGNWLMNAAGKLVYFDGSTLWHSDGTAQGTAALATPIFSQPPHGASVAVRGDTLYVGGSSPFTIPPDPPPAPSSLAASGPPDSVELSWMDNTIGDTWFAVERSTASDFSTIDAIIVTTGNGSLGAAWDTTATLGHRYFYRVQAINEIGKSAWSAPVAGPVPIPGDANGDGTVNFADVLLLAQHYGEPGTFAEGDLNGDGSVGFDDLLILAQNYGSVEAGV